MILTRAQLAALAWSALLMPMALAANTDAEADAFRLEFDNDIFLGSDNLFTDGWSLQWHSRTGIAWEDIASEHFHVAGLGRYLPLLNSKSRKKRHTFAIGQYMQTPTDLDSSDFNPNDAPYAGALILQNSWYDFDDSRFTGFELNLGVTGSNSFAEPSQKLVHEWTGSKEPQGWDHQLKSRAVVNLGYMEKLKLLRWGAGSFKSDLGVSGVVVAGTIYTAAEARLEWRLGHNMPGGFVYTPDEIGATMYYDASLQRDNPAASSYYLSVKLGARRVVYNYFLEGETESGELSIKKEPWVGELRVGAHWLLQSFGFHVTAVITTDVIEQSTTEDHDINDNYGDIMIEYRW